MHSNLKTFIITQNEPFYIPKLIKLLIENSKNYYQIIGYSVLAPHRKNKNYFHWFKERAKIYSTYELMIAAYLFIYTKIYSTVFKNTHYDIRRLLQKNKINEFPTDDVNSIEFINTIRSLNLDVIISISCPQLFREAILDSAKYCINAHGTLLPRHRGVFGSWWTLFSGDKIGGSTIHTMELKLDAGAILWQKEFPIEKIDTQYSIAFKTKRDMSNGLVKVLESIAENKIEKIEPKYDSSYHRAPTKDQGKKFHKKGFKVISLKDIKHALAKEFI